VIQYFPSEQKEFENQMTIWLPTVGRDAILQKYPRAGETPETRPQYRCCKEAVAKSGFGVVAST
jgi:hypothetical protein